jgi:hypothetical protein
VGTVEVERGAPPGPPKPKPKRLIDMKGAEAAKHMLAEAKRRLCPPCERWDAPRAAPGILARYDPARR